MCDNINTIKDLDSRFTILESRAEKQDSIISNLQYTVQLLTKQVATGITPEVETMLTVKDLCKMYNTSYVTLYKRMKTGVLPYKRMGRRIYFDRLEVENAMKVRSNPSRTSNQ